MSSLSEENLVIAARKGDKQAYAALVQRYYSRIYAISLGFLGNTHDAEDAAQEVMIQGFRKISSLRNGKRYKPWIIQIARNICINQIRKNASVQKQLQNSEPIENQIQSDYQTLETSIKKLPQDLRLPLIMFYMDGKNVNTIAADLNMSQSGVYLRLKNAIKELNQLMLEQGDAK